MKVFLVHVAFAEVLYMVKLYTFISQMKPGEFEISYIPYSILFFQDNWSLKNVTCFIFYPESSSAERMIGFEANKNIISSRSILNLKK